MARNKKSRVTTFVGHFDEGEFKGQQYTIKTDGKPETTHVWFNGKEMKNISRLAIIIDANLNIAETEFTMTNYG